ncbi:hypothetical protein B0T26DRAFT_707605 [Lasiosphaeria miniovina]|uniref:Uncharacterized protein n=1 Tax=Lasiosphaeria miniovina TaxID=1954250 RepID=A0AA40AJG4_9PEZI|nr:uncharacterized protein B0T26DRAFT_707605 [Lasiosphaeria miniovina]KAK0716890.1 hypothetical protein B0T26DRAFT_707605 [Lasiosphaeria miniovina]
MAKQAWLLCCVHRHASNLNLQPPPGRPFPHSPLPPVAAVLPGISTPLPPRYY